jgi:signal peptidase I
MAAWRGRDGADLLFPAAASSRPACDQVGPCSPRALGSFRCESQPGMSDRTLGRSGPDDGPEGDPPTDADHPPVPGTSASPDAHEPPPAQFSAQGGTASDETSGAGAASSGQPAADAANRTPTRSRKKRRSLWRELPLLILVALVIALVIKSFVVQAFFIPTGSMENTLEKGDKVLVNKLVYHFRSIQPGDIVVFDGAGSWDPLPAASRPSSDPLVRAYKATLGSLFSAIAGLFGTAPGQTDYIKRVIGVPGDRVVCCNAQGLITVNGVALHEQSYLYPGDTPSEAPEGYSGHFSITVPSGRLWVLGDNRSVSADSRLHREDPGDGTIPENEVIGRAFMIVWPMSRWRILQIPSTFLQPGIVSHASAAALQPAEAVAESSAPFLPLAGGLAGALPLTWLQRVVRRRRSGQIS